MSMRQDDPWPRNRRLHCVMHHARNPVAEHGVVRKVEHALFRSQPICTVDTSGGATYCIFIGWPRWMEPSRLAKHTPV